ncbi:hypothetical protein, partial [Ruthenibacterium lactatiformans]|uniref:hypothetical protein n=1 Tax=Ruthenibacterium lactatiformans TaxID=1550024 RepID=UPI00307C483C
MSWIGVSLIMILVLFALLIPGVWICVALGVSGIVGLIVSDNARYLTTLGTITWNTANNFVLSDVHLFLFKCELIVASGLRGN